MPWFFKEDRYKFSQMELMQNPSLIKKIIKRSDSEILEILLDDIEDKEWFKIKEILSNLKNKDFFIEKIKEETIVSDKIERIIFDKRKISTFDNRNIFHEIDNNISY